MTNNTQPEALMQLADAYAEASFDQGLHKRTLDDAPESARSVLATVLYRLHAYCQELESQVILDCMTHVQNPAEIEHVAGNVSKNGAGLNMSTQHARITELESQLAQRFDAADMATAAAQGFRDGVASVSAVSAVSEPVAAYAIRILVAADLITQAKANEALRLAAEITAAPAPADGESNG